MAADKVVVIEAQTNLKETEQDAKRVNSQLSKMDKLAVGARGPGGKFLKQGQDASQPGTALTGGKGTARDFSEQARGLGGLVRLYSTFAANLFAVTAAFTALQKAAQTDILIRGATILSTQYGVVLKNVANDLKAVTDGALSTAEALQFSTLGASAGLTADQIKNLATVGKTASAALGRDLADSLQRVYRGAIKVEPELLDELGIMVKIDDAVKEYARSNQKAANTLTEFERRQAFVNAVVEQGTSKYKQLGSESTNSFSALSASLQNTLSDLGRLLNTILAPIAKILSENPFLVWVAGLSALSLVFRQAFPTAIQSVELATAKLNEKLAVTKARIEAAAAAKADFDKTQKDVGKSQKGFDKASKASAEAKQQIKDIADIRDELSKAIEDGPIPKSLKAVYDTIQGGDFPAIEALKKAKKDVDTNLRRAQSVQEGSKGYQAAQERARIYQQEALALQNLIVAKEKDIAATNAQKLAEDKLAAAKEKAALVAAGLGPLQEERTRKDEEAVKKLTNVGLVLQNYDSKGFGAAWQQAGELAAKGTGKWADTISAVPLRLRLVGAALTKFLGKGLSLVLGPWGIAADLIFTFGSIAFRALGLTTDQAEKANSALKDMGNTLEALSTSNQKLARAGNINEYLQLKEGSAGLLAAAVDDIEKAAKALDTFNKNGTAIDKWWDKVFGKSIAQKTEQAIATSYIELIRSQSLNEEQQKALVETLIKRQLGPTEKAMDVLKAFSEGKGYAAPTNSKKGIFATLGNILAQAAGYSEKQIAQSEGIADKLDTSFSTQQRITEELKKAFKEQQAALANIKEANTSAQRAVADYITGFLPTGNESKILQAQLTRFTNAFTGSSGDSLIAAFNGITDAELALSGATEETTKAIANIRDSFQFLFDRKTVDSLGELGINTDEVRKAMADSIPVQTAFIKYTLTSANNLYNLAVASATLAKDLASINKSFKILDVLDSAFGKSAETEKRRIELENKKVTAEAAQLNQQQTQLTALRKQQVDNLKATFQTTLASANIDIGDLASAAIPNLLKNIETRINELEGQDSSEARNKLENLKRVSTALVSSSNSLLQLDIAQVGIKAKIATIEQNRVTATEAQRRIESAGLKDSAERQKASLDLDTARLKIANDMLGIRQELGIQSSEEVAYLTKLNNLAQRRNDIQKDIIAADLDAATKTAALRYVQSSQEARTAAIQDSRLQAIFAEIDGKNKGLALQLRLLPLEEKATKLRYEQQNIINLINTQLTIQEGILGGIKAQQQDYRNTAQESLNLVKAEGTASKRVYDTKLASLDVQISQLEAEQSQTEYGKALNIAKITELRLQKQLLTLDQTREQSQLKRVELEKQMRALEEKGLRNSSDYTKYFETLNQDFKARVQELRAASESFGGTLNKGLISAFDNTADELARLFKEGGFSLRNLGEFARNQLAQAFQDSAAQALKNAWKDLPFFKDLTAGKSEQAQNTKALMDVGSSLVDVKTKLPNLTDNMRVLADSINNLSIEVTKLKGPATTTTTLAPTAAQQATAVASGNPIIQASGVAAPATSSRVFQGSPVINVIAGQDGQAPEQSSAETQRLASAAKAAETTSKAAEVSKDASMGFMNAANASLTAAGTLMLFTGQWKQAAFLFLSQLATTMMTTGSASGSALGSIFGALFNAKGGIVGPTGRINTYSTGGIATSPQVAVFGEGSKNEAYVPLPDNKTIPVTLTGAQGSNVSMGDTSITVNVQSNGEVSTEANTQFGKMIGSAIQATVRQEFINQSRPGGLLYSGRR